MSITSNYKVRLLRKALTVLGIGVLFFTLIICGTPALTNAQVFEIDGNTAFDGTAPDDWETVFPGPGSYGVSAIEISDPHSKAVTDENIFKPSGKFGEEANWSIQPGNVGPAQNELTNIYVYALTPAQTMGDSWMIMGMYRTKKQGTFDLDFELNQNPWTDLSRGPYRTAGDITVGFELSGNPIDALADLFVLILRYDPDSTGDNTSTGDPYIREYGAGWWVVFEDFADASIPGTFEATMNAAPFSAPPSPPFAPTLDASGDPVDTVEPFFFAEAALNLTQLGLDVGCPGFGTVHAKTRSSLEITSDLKDLAGPEILEVRCYLFGNKYEDMDGDGDIAEDTGNPLSGWTIRLWRDIDGDGILNEAQDEMVATTTTDPNGYYMFNGLSDGVYHVQEVLESGWTQSYPKPVPPGIHEGIIVDIYNTVSGPHDFGNWRPATKTGVKFEDLDADGAAREGGEPGLPGWTIYVDYNDNGTPDEGEPSTLTGADGSYTITGIKPGTWKVREVLLPGWTNSYPATTDGYGSYHEEVFTSGATLGGNDFGNWAPGTKSGYKYEDLDGDGNIAEDTGNPLSGWTIRAYNDDGDGILEQPEYDAGPVVTSNTNIAGAYSLTLDPGDYIIVEVLQNNWLQSYPSAIVLDPGLITGSETLGSSGYAITLTSRGTHIDNNFGNYQSADLEVMKSGMITYTVRVTNNGPSAASNVVVNDVLPGDLEWGIAPPVPPEFTTISITGNTLHGTISSLASEMHAEVTVAAEIPQGDAENALLPNTATASSDTPDPNTDNNSADADIGQLP